MKNGYWPGTRRRVPAAEACQILVMTTTKYRRGAYARPCTDLPPAAVQDLRRRALGLAWPK